MVQGRGAGEAQSGVFTVIETVTGDPEAKLESIRGRRSRFGGLAVGIVLAVVGLMLTWPATVSAANASSPTDLADVCDLAAVLTDSDPEAAIELIVAARASEIPGATVARRTACSTQLDDAAASVALGTDLALAAEGACAAAGSLIASGRTEEAKAILEGSSESDDAFEQCPDLFESADAEHSVPAPSPTPKDAATRWDDFVEDVLTPFASTGAFLLGAWAALLVLARLIAFLPHLRDRDDSTAERRKDRAIGGAILLILAPPLAWVASSATADDPWAGFLWFAAILLGLGGVGAWTIAWPLATSSRLSIEVPPNGDKTVDSSVVAAAVRDMLGTGATGLEIPIGPDVKDVSDALTQLSDNKWTALLQKVWLFLTNIRPWRLTVSVKSADTASYSIERNGRQVASGDIRAANGRLGEKTDEGDYRDGSRIAAFAAAALVEALAGRYEDMRPDLHGATVGTGIALQYIASKGYQSPAHRAAAVHLLGKAVDADLGNRAAIFTLKHREFRDETAPEKLAEYRAWLSAFCKEAMERSLPTQANPIDLREPAVRSASWVRDDLIVRALTMFGVVSRNMLAVPRPSETIPTSSMRSDSLVIAEFFVKLLDVRKELDEERRRKLGRRVDVDPAPDDRKRKVLAAIDVDRFNMRPGECRDHEAPKVAYSLACHYAQFPEGQSSEHDPSLKLRDEIPRLLMRAFADSDLREWAKTQDPELEPLRGDPTFSRLFAGERDGRLTREPFLRSSFQLRKDERTATLDGLARVTADDELATKLGLSEARLGSLVRAAKIAQLLPQQSLDGFEWAGLEWLFYKQRLTVAALRDAAGDHRISAALHADLRSHGYAGSAGSVEAWLKGLSESVKP